MALYDYGTSQVNEGCQQAYLIASGGALLYQLLMFVSTTYEIIGLH
jgi:hypothetical protein